QIGRLLGNLGDGALMGDAAIDSMFGFCVASLILGAWLGVGHFVVSAISIKKSESHSHILEMALKVAVGAAIWSLVWFFIGIAGAYSPTIALILVIAGQVLLSFAFRRAKEVKEESRMPEKVSGIDYLLLVLIAIPVVLSLIGALAPPTAKDTLLYHFA